MPDAITIQDLRKEYNGTSALQGISFSIKQGEFFALLGPNGAGKTTTINILTGLTNKTSGQALLFDKDVVKDYQEARALIGLVPQEFNFDQFEKVYNVLYFNAGYFGIPRKERSPRIQKILQELQLWDKKDAKARELSGGMKRKLMIARALIHQPQILILDEPTAGVDVETRKMMWSYLKKLNQQGITILLTTHYIEEAEELCQRIAIINKGKIVVLDEKKNLLKVLESERINVYLGTKLTKIPHLLEKYHPALENNLLSFFVAANSWSTILADLQKANVDIERLETQRNKLEDIFIHFTKQ